MERLLIRSLKYHFVGFHDICPWSEDGAFFICHETELLERMPKEGERATILLKDISTGEEIKLGETGAWNFHQGARLQWIPNENRKLIFNDERDGFAKAVIYDIENRSEKVLPIPVYAIHPSGEFGIGVNFKRLMKYGGYGYHVGISGMNENESFPLNDGIFKVDFETGESKLLLSIKDITGIIYINEEL